MAPQRSSRLPIALALRRTTVSFFARTLPRTRPQCWSASEDEDEDMDEEGSDGEPQAPRSALELAQACAPRNTLGDGGRGGGCQRAAGRVPRQSYYGVVPSLCSPLQATSYQWHNVVPRASAGCDAGSEILASKTNTAHCCCLNDSKQCHMLARDP